jgi:hypothetical protein
MLLELASLPRLNGWLTKALCVIEAGAPEEWRRISQSIGGEERYGGMMKGLIHTLSSVPEQQLQIKDAVRL